MALKYELMVANGTYQNQQGEQKTSWLKIGAIMSKQNGGFVMKLDAIPTNVIDLDGNSVPFNGWVNMFEPKSKEDNRQASQPAQSQQAAPPVPDNFHDDIPFANPYKRKEYVF